ncbi:class I mannose-6-phosphate isomerase [Butyrivibrio sp. MC2013]|uniref:class I mannose-6-phosphate isomerase n=1 Tax=Butyrivibrio sp. MC2013 TaxID=1280686 RepID=UPI00040A4D2F|nr:class I mannose-6-phosphate isomerase [Butyrivibrio sp. MC2013]
MNKITSYNNYDPAPVTRLEGYDDQAFGGRDRIIEELKSAISGKCKDTGRDNLIISFDLYPGVYKEEILSMARELGADTIIDVETAAKPEKVRMKEFEDFITDDRVFGVICHKNVQSLYDSEAAALLRERIAKERGPIILIGFATELFARADIHVYCDMSRWETQLRYRKGMPNWNCSNTDAPFLTKYKIGYFIEWRLADRYKREHFEDMDYLIDSHIMGVPSMVAGEAFREAIRKVAARPFRLEPYFDPGVWGGHWMQDKLGVGRDQQNLAWCFDGVPEENALNLGFGDTIVQFPAMDITLYCPRPLLGERVHGRYGAEFPIRFDFLDTIGGENLSLQVHPLTEYIQDKFGMHYTQDESYYILDVDEDKDNYVYLGVKKDVDKAAMARDLRAAEKGSISFPAENYVNKVPVKKHDHLLIPAGTVHCSGAGCMVLEISATPYIFTFKLWDWDRLGLDGLPRPIHVEHGLRNIQWDRDTDYVYDQLVHQEMTVAEGEGYKVERTGLHSREPIEVMRYSLEAPLEVECDDSVIQANLVSGREAVIESIDNSFPPLTVHYAETFIIPASVGRFRLVPLADDVKVVMASIRK